MKKVIFLMLAMTMSLGFISCSSDDDNNEPNYSVVGRWEVTSYTVNGVAIEECELNGVRQFRTDGSYLQDEFEEDENGNCTETVDSPAIGTYSKSGNNLTTTVGVVTKTYKIEFVNESRFTLTETFNNIDFIYTYSKIN